MSHAVQPFASINTRPSLAVQDFREKYAPQPSSPTFSQELRTQATQSSLFLEKCASRAMQSSFFLEKYAPTAIQSSFFLEKLESATIFVESSHLLLALQTREQQFFRKI